MGQVDHVRTPERVGGPLSRRPESGLRGRLRGHGAAMTIGALALLAVPARAQDGLAPSAAARDAALGAPIQVQLGRPVNEAEVRDTAVAAPSPLDQAPFTPAAQSELGRAGQDEDAIRPSARPVGYGVKLSPWLIVAPVARSFALYDTNVRRATSGLEQADVELTNSIGADAVAATRRFQLTLGYLASFRNFIRLTDLNALEHRARARVAFAGRDVALRGRFDFASLERPNDPRFTTGSLNRRIWDGGLSVAIRLSRRVDLLPELYGAYEDYTGQFDPSDHVNWGTNLLVALKPHGGRQVLFILGGGYGELRYTNPDAIAPDLRTYTALGGIEVHLRSILVGQLRLGYTWSQVTDRRQLAPGEGGPQGFVLTAIGRWQPLRLTALFVDATRQVDFTTTNTSQLLTRVGVGLEQLLPARLGATARFVYELQEPVGAPRSQSLFASLGVTWTPLRWLQLAVEGSYLRRTSTLGDYDVFRIGGGLQLQY
jgi:hypothetical protein